MIPYKNTQIGVGLGEGIKCFPTPQDCSPAPLFTSVDPSVLSLPVYEKLSALYDNYVASPAGVAEDHTEQEHQEEMELLEVLSCPGDY